MSSPSTPAQLAELAASVAHVAGDVLLYHQRRLRSGADLSVATKTSATDPVSMADQESEQALVRAIEAARPDDGILGEEGADRTGSSGLRWVVDPLDGTVNYLYGHIGWGVSVAVEQLAEDGSWHGLAAAVFEPTTGIMHSAHRGGGATANGRPLQYSADAPLCSCTPQAPLCCAWHGADHEKYCFRNRPLRCRISSL